MPLATLEDDASTGAFMSTHAAMPSQGGLGTSAPYLCTERTHHGQSMAKAEPFRLHLDGRGRKATLASFAS